MNEEKICGDGAMDEFIKEIEIKKGEKDKLTKDVDGLEELNTILGPTLEKYRKAIPGFRTRKLKIEDYSKKKTPMINSGVGKKKTTADNIIKLYDDQIKNLEKEIDIIKNKEKPDAENQYIASEKKCEIEGKKPFEELKEVVKNYEKIIDTKLDDLESLWNKIEEVEKENKESTLPTMYFLIVDLNNIYNGTDIKKSEELASELHRIWKSYDDLKKDAREKDEKLVSIINKLESKEKKLDELKNKRRADILESIKKEPWEKS